MIIPNLEETIEKAEALVAERTIALKIAGDMGLGEIFKDGSPYDPFYDALNDALTLLRGMEWKSVEEMPPPIDAHYLVLAPGVMANHNIIILRWDNQFGWGSLRDLVLAWMPIPQPPEVSA